MSNKHVPDTGNTMAIRARWVLPVDQPPIADGVISLRAGRIVAVGKSESDRPPCDLGNVVVLPGLVNAHTHLEFSDLTGPLGRPHMSFAEWIGCVVAYRRSQGPAGKESKAASTGQSDPLPAAQSNSTSDQNSDQISMARTAAIRAGLDESLRCGTTLLGDIATAPWSAVPLQTTLLQEGTTQETSRRNMRPGGVVFHEILGLAEDRREPLLQDARRYVVEQPEHPRQSLPEDWSVGLSPHAPYTVNFELLRDLIELSAQRRVPLAMHVAETLEELELLGSHSGPLVERLRSLDAWHPNAVPRGIQPGDYLEQLSRAHRSLVIHGNYLTSDDYHILAKHRERMSLVFCPRTHDFFGHERYPLPEILKAGVRVTLGTDSRASNPDLSLMAELRFVADRFQAIAPDEIVRMATLSGAEALGRDSSCGSITASKRADLTIIALPETDVDDPYAFLWTRDAKIRSVVLGGTFLDASL